MIRCPSCDEKISSKETECPYCGEEIPERGPKKSGLKKKKKGSGSSGSMLVIILGIVAVGVVMCGGVMIALLLPAVQQAREAARRTQCKNNLKQIGLAMHNYHDTYRYFPAAHLDDENGRPRISWRVSILPYIDQGPLYNNYDMNTPWDSPNNSRLMNPIPQNYLCPSHSTPGSINTAYATITGPDTLLGDGTCWRISDTTDGTSNTVMVVEACQANIPWMKPQDLPENGLPPVGDPNGISSKHTGGAHVLMADGSVRFISQFVNQNVINALTTRNKGEIVGDF